MLLHLIRANPRKSAAEKFDMFLKELISQGWQALMRDRTRSVHTGSGDIQIQ